MTQCQRTSEHGNSCECVEESPAGNLHGGQPLSAREDLRRSFRPKAVSILFVGEAPPASGRFFYRADSGLYRALRDTFIATFPDIQEEQFLPVFRDSGCYLVDLCSEPVDRMSRSDRSSACRAGEARLARQIADLQPGVVITVVQSIRENVKRAEEQAGWSGVHEELPYPGRWKHLRVQFEQKLSPVLRAVLPTSIGDDGHL